LTEPKIPRSEYEERWRRAQEEARARGLDGLVVFSRAGTVMDSYADAMYLVNHYNGFVLCNDLPRWWVGRTHAGVVLPLDGEPTLVIDVPDWRRDLVATDDVRLFFNVPEGVAQVMRDRGLAGKRVGLVAHSMLLSPYRHLVEAADGTEFVQADDLIEGLRIVKSPRELDLLRASGEVGSRVLQAIMERALEPGVTEADAVAAGVEIAVKETVAVYDAAVASGPNSMGYTHGRLPSWTGRELESGDFFHIDTYGALDGYLYDFSRTCVVGGSPDDDQREVLEALIDSIEAGIAVTRPGAKARDVYAAVRSVLDERGMTGDGFEGDIETTPALTSAFPGHGHNFGLFWEPPWLVVDEESEIQAGMCLGIEAMAGRPGVGAAKFEQDVIVTDDGTELLTTTDKRFW
jgi:ectoine hydrolase